ncbi:MAG: pilus assembly protein PilM [Candidatus Kerfeldbacteria bacterium]|nr:pilus assembly protein PilM [Candidatus Kerfeldbacteria bacterium]
MQFLGKKTGYVGVDIGSASLKVVELKEDKGRPRLVTYGYTEQETNVIKSDSLETQDYIIEAIKTILVKARVTSRNVVSALPSFAVFSSVISLPSMPQKELIQAIRWEAKKFVPMPIEEMVLDWKVLKNEHEKGEESANLGRKPATELQVPAMSTQEEHKEPKSDLTRVFANPFKKKEDSTNPEKAVQVLLTAAPKSLVDRYVTIFQKANLKLVSLETQAFALQRSLIGNDQSAIMILDIGAVSTDISVVVKGIPVLNRSIDVGGESLTKAIGNSMNVDHARAEQFKRDFGLTNFGDATKIPKAIEFVFSSIVNEIQYVLNLYSGQHETAIEKIILAGGSAFLPHLTEHLSTTLKIKTYIGDPWARIVYPVDLKPVLAELGPRFAVALGLAMREIV